MPRKPRLFVSGATYFVYGRVARGEFAFDDPSEAEGFVETARFAGRESYLAWIRAVAEARWLALGLEELPWWKEARTADEIVEHEKHPEATTFDGGSPNIERLSVDLVDFAPFFERFSDHSIADLSSPLRIPNLTRGRIELGTLAVTRFEIRSIDIADLIGKHRSSITGWLNIGPHRLRHDPGFRLRLDSLERKISSAARNNASMRPAAP
jgi:hypothetical protein